MTAQEKEHSSERVVWEENFAGELTSDLELEKSWGAGGGGGGELTVSGRNLRQGRKKSEVSYMLSLLEYNVQIVVWR